MARPKSAHPSQHVFTSIPKPVLVKFDKLARKQQMTRAQLIRSLILEKIEKNKE